MFSYFIFFKWEAGRGKIETHFFTDELVTLLKMLGLLFFAVIFRFSLFVYTNSFQMIKPKFHKYTKYLIF